MVWDETLLFLSSLLTLYAIVRRVVVTVARRNHVERETITMLLQATWAQFRADGLRGEEMILLALLIPIAVLTVYYLLLLLPLPAFESDIALRRGMMRSSIFTGNAILAIYFLNGRLTRGLRHIIDSWKRQSHTS